MGKIQLISVQEFCTSHGVEHSFLLTLQEYGFIAIDKEKFLTETELPKVEKIMRLHNEMDINFEGIDVILNLLERIESMESKLTQLRNRLGLYE